MLDWLAVIPWIGPRANLDGFLASARFTRDEWPRVLLVDNSPTSAARELGLEDKGVRVEYHPENIGIARAWNLGLREGHDQTIVCSASVRLTGPRGWSDYLDVVERHASRWGLHTAAMAWHLSAVGRATVDRIGCFDEGFYPAYYEDADYDRRRGLAGIAYQWPLHSEIVKLPAVSAGHGLAVREGGAAVNFRACCDRFIAKWGGDPNHGSYTHPWNDPANAPSYWPQESIETLRDRYNLR